MTLWTAGSSRASRITITTITTSSSTSVKPPERETSLATKHVCYFPATATLPRVRLCRGSAGRVVASFATARLLRRFICCGVFCSVCPTLLKVLPSPPAALRKPNISGPRGQRKPMFPGSCGRVVAGSTARETSYSTAARFRERTLR